VSPGDLPGGLPSDTFLIAREYLGDGGSVALVGGKEFHARFVRPRARPGRGDLRALSGRIGRAQLGQRLVEIRDDLCLHVDRSGIGNQSLAQGDGYGEMRLALGRRQLDLDSMREQGRVGQGFTVVGATGE